MAANLRAAREAAEDFRIKHIRGTLRDGRMPIDSVFIADNILRLDIIPFPKLSSLLSSPAAITPCLTQLYVDEDLYASYDSNYAPKWKKDRLRFSVAHELGHLHMHKGHINRVRCQEMEDLKALFNTIDDFRNEIEGEANEFAGRLLAPLEVLQEAMAKYGALQPNPRWRESSSQRDEFVTVCSHHFGLHEDSIKARLNRDDVWPSSWATSG